MLQVDLKGRTALVTGSSTGIGRAIALGFARNGADVAVHYRRNKDAAAEVANKARDEGRKAIAVRADLGQKSEVEALFAEVEDAFGKRLDILVNNAGSLVKRASVADMDEDTFDRIVGVNFRSVFLCSQAAIPKLPDETGRIVNVSRKGCPHFHSATPAVMETESPPPSVPESGSKEIHAGSGSIHQSSVSFPMF